jgi:hypothetical protein
MQGQCQPHRTLDRDGIHPTAATAPTPTPPLRTPARTRPPAPTPLPAPHPHEVVGDGCKVKSCKAAGSMRDLSFDIYYSTERTGAPRDIAEGYSDTGRAQWDVSQGDVSTQCDSIYFPRFLRGVTFPAETVITGKRHRNPKSHFFENTNIFRCTPVVEQLSFLYPSFRINIFSDSFVKF